MANNVIRLDFQVLVYRESAQYIAHCLETDLAAEGNSVKESLENLIDISNLQIESLMAEGDLNSLFSPAPPDIWRMFSMASDRPSAPRRPARAVKPINRIRVRQLEAV